MKRKRQMLGKPCTHLCLRQDIQYIQISLHTLLLPYLMEITKSTIRNTIYAMHNTMWNNPISHTTTNRHVLVGFDFETVSCCDQLVFGPTHSRGGTLDLPTGDPDLVRVAVVALINNSDNSSPSAFISMAQAVPNLWVSMKVFLKHQVNWNTVCGEIQDLPWRDIWSADNPVVVLNEHL